jgi:hypothetical protein
LATRFIVKIYCAMPDLDIPEVGRFVTEARIIAYRMFAVSGPPEHR